MNRHLIALITFLALIPLVYFIPSGLENFLTPLLIAWNLPVRLSITILAVATIVPIISYLVIPFMAKVFARFNR